MKNDMRKIKYSKLALKMYPNCVVTSNWLYPNAIKVRDTKLARRVYRIGYIVYGDFLIVEAKNYRR